MQALECRRQRALVFDVVMLSSAILIPDAAPAVAVVPPAPALPLAPPFPFPPAMQSPSPPPPSPADVQDAKFGTYSGTVPTEDTGHPREHIEDTVSSLHCGN